MSTLSFSRLLGSSLVITGFLLAACGPMNEEVAKGSKPADQQKAPMASDQRASKAGRFLGHVYLGERDGQEVTSLPLGENNIHIRLVKNATLEPISAQAQVRFVVEMPSMPEMGQETMEGLREADGTYSAIIFLSMAGEWRVSIQIDDLGQKDDYVLMVLAK